MTDERLIELYEADTLIKDIAKLAGRSEHTINNRLTALRKQGRIGYRRQPLSQDHPKRKLAKLHRELIAKFATEGLTNTQIADRLGLHPIYVAGFAANARQAKYDEEIARLESDADQSVEPCNAHFIFDTSDFGSGRGETVVLTSR